MVALFIGLIFFHNQQNQDFVSIIESMQDEHQKVYPFYFVYHHRIFVGKQNENWTEC